MSVRPASCRLPPLRGDPRPDYPMRTGTTCCVMAEAVAAGPRDALTTFFTTHSLFMRANPWRKRCLIQLTPVVMPREPRMSAASFSPSTTRHLPVSPLTCWGRARVACPVGSIEPTAAHARCFRPRRRACGMRRVLPTGSQSLGGSPTGERPSPRQRWWPGPRRSYVARAKICRSLARCSDAMGRR